MGGHPGRQACGGTWRAPVAGEPELTLRSDGEGRGVQRPAQELSLTSSPARRRPESHPPPPPLWSSRPLCRSPLGSSKDTGRPLGLGLRFRGTSVERSSGAAPALALAQSGLPRGSEHLLPTASLGGAAGNTLSVGPGAGMGQKAEASRVLGTRGPAGQLCLNLLFLLGLPLEALVCSFTSRLASIYSVPGRHRCPGDAATTSTKMRGYKAGWGGGAGGQWTALEREARGV